MKPNRKGITIRLSNNNSTSFLLDINLTEKQHSQFRQTLSAAQIAQFAPGGYAERPHCRYLKRGYYIQSKTKTDLEKFFYAIGKFCVANKVGLTKYTIREIY